MKEIILGLALMSSASAFADQAGCEKLAEEVATSIKNINKSDMGNVTSTEVKNVRNDRSGGLIYTIDVSFGKDFNPYHMTVSSSFDSCYVIAYEI
jgi:hypothetical protein